MDGRDTGKKVYTERSQEAIAAPGRGRHTPASRKSSQLPGPPHLRGPYRRPAPVGPPLLGGCRLLIVKKASLHQRLPVGRRRTAGAGAWQAREVGGVAPRAGGSGGGGVGDGGCGPMPAADGLTGGAAGGAVHAGRRGVPGAGGVVAGLDSRGRGEWGAGAGAPQAGGPGSAVGAKAAARPTPVGRGRASGGEPHAGAARGHPGARARPPRRSGAGSGPGGPRGAGARPGAGVGACGPPQTAAEAGGAGTGAAPNPAPPRRTDSWARATRRSAPDPTPASPTACKNVPRGHVPPTRRCGCVTAERTTRPRIPDKWCRRRTRNPPDYVCGPDTTHHARTLRVHDPQPEIRPDARAGLQDHEIEEADSGRQVADRRAPLPFHV